MKLVLTVRRFSAVALGMGAVVAVLAATTWLIVALVRLDGDDPDSGMAAGLALYLYGGLLLAALALGGVGLLLFPGRLKHRSSYLMVVGATCTFCVVVVFPPSAVVLVVGMLGAVWWAIRRGNERPERGDGTGSAHEG